MGEVKAFCHLRFQMLEKIRYSVRSAAKKEVLTANNTHVTSFQRGKPPYANASHHVLVDAKGVARAHSCPVFIDRIYGTMLKDKKPERFIYPGTHFRKAKSE